MLAVSFSQAHTWLAKANFSEDLHPRDAAGRFISAAENIVNGNKSMDEVLRLKTDVHRAMHRPGVGHIAFRYGDSKSGVAHIVERHGEETARKMPSVIGNGSISHIETAQGRDRVHIEHEGFRAVLSPDYHGEPGHWLVTGFQPDVKKAAPGAAGDLNKGRSELHPDVRFNEPAGGAGADANIHLGGATMKAFTFATVQKDLTVGSVHVNTAIGNEDDEKKPKKPGYLGGEARPLEKRSLQPHDDTTAKTPFLYDCNALANIRPDQAPRFLGALTDSDKLPEQEVNLSDLVAMQDRVDPAKVKAIADAGGGKLPVVVGMGGKHYIADGHHRLAAQWLAGQDKAKVKFKDLEPVSNAMKRAEPLNFRVAKVDDSLGMVFGFAIVCKVNGEDYYDLNVDQEGPHAGKRVPEHCPENVMAKAAAEFMESARSGNEMHSGPDVGHYVFAFPLTSDIAKAMNIQTEKTGLMVAYKAPDNVLQKFRDGTYTGFSIEGKRLQWTEHE